MATVHIWNNQLSTNPIPDHSFTGDLIEINVTDVKEFGAVTVDGKFYMYITPGCRIQLVSGKRLNIDGNIVVGS